MKALRGKRALGTLSLVIFLLSLALVALAWGIQVSQAAPLPERLARPLHQTADVAPISNIVGATYNAERGEIIVFGVADPTLPPLDMTYIRENLAVALRSFYHSTEADIPGVSIEGTLDPLDVIYFGVVTDTHFGQVSFESDRLLKIYTMGADNLTGSPVTSDVSGYMSYPDRMQLLEETVEDPILIRYFFTPTLLIEPIASPHTIIFSQTQKLVDWAYASTATSPASAQAAQGFVDNFNQYYVDYAAERRTLYGDTTLYEMVQLSKLTAIAQWAYESGLELTLPGLNDPWLRDYPVVYAPTVTQTPGITVTWTQIIGGSSYELSLRGGVYAIGDVLYILPTEEGQGLADDIFNECFPAPPSMMCLIRPNLPRPLRPTAEPVYPTQGPLVGYIVSLADNALVNGDFEDGPGSLPWVQNSAFEMIGSESPLNGEYSALFPIYHNAAVSLYQTFHIPQDAQQARLTYWRAAATAETSGPYDYFAAFLTAVSGQKLTTFENLSDRDADNYWHQVSFDVTSYAGQTVQLWFTATTDSSNITNFFVDDISLDYLDLTPPSVVMVTQTPERVLLGDEVTFALAFRERMDTSVAPTVTLSLKDSAAPYTVTAKTGVGYTNGYLDSDPRHWYGDYTFAAPMAGGIYTLTVSAAQDLARNVMFPQAAHTLLVTPLTVALPINGAGTYVFGDTCMELSFAPETTGALQTVTTTLVYTYPTGQGAPYPLPRKYVIGGNVDGGFTAVLSLCYDDGDLDAANISGAAEASLTLYRYDTDSQTWVPYPTTVDTVTNRLSTTVTGFSTWAIGTEQGGHVPTAITIRNFRRASATSVVSWIGLCSCVLVVGGGLVWTRRAIRKAMIWRLSVDYSAEICYTL